MVAVIARYKFCIDENMAVISLVMGEKFMMYEISIVGRAIT